jgi:hypothetical protein
VLLVLVLVQLPLWGLEHKFTAEIEDSNTNNEPQSAVNKGSLIGLAPACAPNQANTQNTQAEASSSSSSLFPNYNS